MWDDLAAWFQSPGGARVLQTAIIPALAILVAGVLAALIARSAVRATIRRAERVEAASVVAGLVAAARLTADAGDDSAARRRAARLRAEADVRARLLPLPGADVAADWAAARTDALQQHPAGGAASAELAELRDRLVDWVGKPSRARRIFSAPAAPPVARPSTDAAPAAVPEVGATAPVAAPAPASAAAEPVQEVPGPRRTPPEPEAAAAPVDQEPEPALAEHPPAWQRTRAGERLQQERSRTRAVEPPTVEEEPVPLSTAPVSLQRTHRADADAEEAVRLEEHQQARHARPAEPATAGAVPAAAPTPAPAWLDTYDDEAQVTQNLDLKTPPPVAASAVRDRGAPGDDLVPRS